VNAIIQVEHLRKVYGDTVAVDDISFEVEDGRRIRANYRHSIPVDLGLEPLAPPEFLFHGTATRFLEAIKAEGLVPS